MIRCFIGLGSNLEDPVQQVRDALAELSQLPRSSLRAQSSLYRSDPVGPAGQPDYINAVAELATDLEAHELLDQLQAIEQLHQRKRVQHWGPRTLDLDLLLYGEQHIESSRLTVPHPYLSQREFVLYPLAEIASDLQLPAGIHIDELLAKCPMGSLQQVDL